MNNPHLSIIIPAYNESQRILPTLETIKAFIDKQSYSVEVIVVDDCSTDKTRDIVGAFVAGKNNFTLTANTRNLGKGASVKKGMLIARGAFRLFSDADLSTPIDEVHKFFTLLENSHDIVIGSRRVKGANVVKRQPIYREASGRVFSVLVRLLLMRGFLDTQCGFKMFTATAAQSVFPKLTINGFGFDVEALYIAKEMQGLKIKEAPVSWFDSPNSQVRLWRDATRMFTDLLRIRWNRLCGRY
jgi:dolichyl-phosphate beta-glucosyltransferase